MPAATPTPAGNTLKANRDLALHLGGNFANAGGCRCSKPCAISPSPPRTSTTPLERVIDSVGTTLEASGNLTNDGRIEGDDITLKAATIGNTGTVIGGDIA